MICIWIQYVPTHFPNMHCQTGNVCFVIVKIVHVLISQLSNKTSITQTHELQYVFVYTKWSHDIHSMPYVHNTEKTSLLFYTVPQNASIKKPHIRKELVTTEKFIFGFNTSFYIPDIKKIVFHLPRVCILGTIHCGNKRCGVFKRRGFSQYMLCRNDYEEQLVVSFVHQI